MFIGLPIISIVFGSEGLPYLFTFYLVSIVTFWSLGAYTLSRASDNAGSSFSVKNILSPGLIGVLIGCDNGREIHHTSSHYLGSLYPLWR